MAKFLYFLFLRGDYKGEGGRKSRVAKQKNGFFKKGPQGDSIIYFYKKEFFSSDPMSFKNTLKTFCDLRLATFLFIVV